MTLRHSVLCLSVLLLATAAGSAQILPSEQTESLYAPAGVRTDGSAIEWRDGFQAYNKATQVHYSIADDGRSVYLVIQAARIAVVEKILAGGITLTIDHPEKARYATPLTLTFPVLPPAEKWAIAKPVRDRETDFAPLVPTVNRRLTLAAKDLHVSGIAGLREPVVAPLSNELGIRAAVLLDKERALTYEVQIPLNYLAELTDEHKTFRYTVTLNGASISSLKIKVNGSEVDSSSPDVVSLVRRMAEGHGQPNALDNLISPMDFSATYTLVKQ